MFQSISAARFILSLVTQVGLLLLIGSFHSVVAQGAGGGGVDLTGTGGKHSIIGRIYFPSGVRADTRLLVRLESTRYNSLTVLADTNGSFGFRSLLPGSYTVVIDGDDIYETVRETVYIDGEATRPRSGLAMPTTSRNYQVQVHLQPKRIVLPDGRVGVVNAALAAVPEQARKAYERSLESISNGDHKQAIEHLKQAVALFPSFPIALNELGVQYLKVGEVDSAVEALRSAVKLDPGAFTPRLNYGIALLQKKNFADAKTHLEQALQKNQNSASAHLYLGITLIHEQRYLDAEQSFHRSIREGKGSLGLAHYYLGGLYWRRGEHKLAADELEKYLLVSPGAQDAEKVKSTIKELRSKK